MSYYKYEEELLSASNFISFPDMDLVDVDHELYEYPIDGWYWFDSEEEAKSFFGVKDELL
jgi:hypothetical protein